MCVPKKRGERIMTETESKPSLWELLQEDRAANATSLKGRWMVVAFRLAWWVRRRNRWIYYLLSPYLVLYRVTVEWFLGMELPPLTEVGRRLTIHHGQGLVVNNQARLGCDCVLRHGVTIGNSEEGGGCPVIGNGVEIGANALVLGAITVGDGAKIGAGAVVVKNVPAGAVMVGNPARILEPRK